jgi:hypothetical protein
MQENVQLGLVSDMNDKNELMNCDIENNFLLVYLSYAPGHRRLTPLSVGLLVP